MNTKIILDSINEKNKTQARRVVDIFKSNGFKSIPSEAYPSLITVLNSIYNKEHEDAELKDIVTDGDGDGGVDVIVFLKDTVDIFDIKESKNLGLRELQQLKNCIKSLFYNRISDFNNSDYSRIKNHLQRYYSLTDKKSYKIRLFIIRESFADFNDSIKKVVKSIEDFGGIEIIYINHEEILRQYIDIGSMKTPWIINKISSKDDGIITKKKGGDDLSFVIMKIPVIKLLELYKENKDYIFSDNIRIPKNKRDFSLGLSETIENESENFFLFHNGITITANRIKRETASHFSVYNPKIVNGAQTIGGIFSKYKNDLESNNLNRATIICKIIVADSILTDQICETANTQKAVSASDLRTNDIFQKELEIYINNKSKGIYKYNRKGEKKISGSINIDYIKFFQWAYAAILEKPAKSKGAKGNIFENEKRGEYENIKKFLRLKCEKIVLLCDIGIAVNNFIKNEKDSSKKSFLKHSDMHIIAGLYLLKSTKEVDFNKIVSFLENYYQEQIGIDSTLNENKVFTKSEETWSKLKKELKK